MDVSKVSMADGKACAQLLNLLRSGKWELSGADATVYVDTVRWVHGLATSMAAQLKDTSPVPASGTSSLPPGGMKVKSITPMSSPSLGSKKKTAGKKRK